MDTWESHQFQFLKWNQIICFIQSCFIYCLFFVMPEKTKFQTGKQKALVDFFVYLHIVLKSSENPFHSKLHFRGFNVFNKEHPPFRLPHEKNLLGSTNHMLDATPARGSEELDLWGAGALLEAAPTPGAGRWGTPHITGGRQAPEGAGGLQYATIYQQK